MIIKQKIKDLFNEEQLDESTLPVNPTKEDLDTALAHKSWRVRFNAAAHPNATKEHLDKALNDKEVYVRSAAAANPNATKEHLDKALTDKIWHVRMTAADHPNATKEHLDKALTDKDKNIQMVASRRLKSIKKSMNQNEDFDQIQTGDNMSIEQKINELLSEQKDISESNLDKEQETSNLDKEQETSNTDNQQFDISEDVAALINGEDLTEEFKQKAATIFEAAVVTRVQAELVKLEEEYEVQLQEEVEQIKEGLSEKVDGYLDYVVEQWMEQNEIALERGMKSEILENFVSGLKTLFEEHYIDVPEEKFDVMGNLESTIEDLSKTLDEQVEINVELNREIAKFQVQKIISDLSEGLVETDKEKFVALVEELEFNGVETFEKKAQTIRESYFTAKAPVVPTTTGDIVTDTPVALTEETIVDPVMRNYVSTIAKSIR